MTTRQTPSRERGNCGQEIASNFANKWWVPHHLKGSFTCRKSVTWDRRLYFPSEGSHAEDFFALKNLMASAGFKPKNLGTRSQHANPQTTEATKSHTYHTQQWGSRKVNTSQSSPLTSHQGTAQKWYFPVCTYITFIPILHWTLPNNKGRVVHHLMVYRPSSVHFDFLL
jgi:hypothetical protein